MLLELDAPIDWKGLLLDFVRWGWTLKGVARAINVPPSTLRRWWDDGSEPHFEHGRALLKLHGIAAEKRCSDPSGPGEGVQRILASPEQPKEASVAKRNQPKQVRSPGTEPEAQLADLVDPADTKSDPDAAIEAAAQGKARRIAKPRAPVAPSAIVGDPQRPAEQPVNLKREMPYAEAMQALERGELKRNVLTERGWVVAPNRQPPAVAKA